MRSLTRRIGALAVVVIALAAAAAAIGYWSTSGSGDASATVGTLTAASISTSATSSGYPTITWDSQATTGNASADGDITYRVERRNGADPFAEITTGACSGPRPRPTASCQDDSLATGGTYDYRVVAHYHSSWTATSNIVSVVVTLDGTAPTTTDNAPSGWSNSPVTVTLTATDSGTSGGSPSGIASITYSVDGGASTLVNVPGSPVSSSTVVAIAASASHGNDGSHTISYYATDAAGNAETSHDATVKIDTQKPATVATGADAGWHKSAVTVHLAATDQAGLSGVANIKYSDSFGGGQQTIIGASGDVVVGAPSDHSQDGLHTISYFATDVAGNIETSGSVVVKIDTTAPSVTVTPARAPDLNGWYNHAVSFTASGTDALSGGVTCDSSTSYSGPDSASASVTMHCLDAAGNTGSATSVFKYDATKPVVTSVNPDRSPNASDWYTASVTWTAVGTDATSGIASCQSSAYAGPDTNAPGITVSRTCTDQAGNVSNAAAGATFKYDSTAPTVTAVNASRVPDANGWYNHAVTWTAGGSDSAPGSGLATCQNTPYSGPDSASASVSGLTCTDNAGNVSTGSVANSFKYDATVPTNALTLINQTGGSFIAGSTLYYRGASAGSFAFSNTLSDILSGAASSRTGALAGTATGWTHAASTVATPVGGPFVSNPFNWIAGTTSSPTETITGFDSAGNQAATILGFVNDNAAPTGGAFTVNGTAATAAGSTSSNSTGSFTIGSRTDYAETQTGSQSGLASSLLTVQSATLTSGTCGAAGSGGPYATPATVAGTSNPAITGGFCYLYTLTGADNVANTATVKSTVKVTSSPTITSPTSGSQRIIPNGTTATFTVVGTNFVSGVTVSISGGTGSGDFTLNSTTFVDSGHITVNVTAQNGVGHKGTSDITVTNPDGGSVTSTGSIVNS